MVPADPVVTAKPAEAVPLPHHLAEHLPDGRAGDRHMPQVIAELVELVEDHQVLAGSGQFVALVEDLLDVGLRPRGLDDLPRHRLQPLEAFPAHSLREDGHRLAAQQVGVVGAAPAVVTGGRPHRLLGGRVELAGDETRDQATEGGSHLVRTGGEPLADQGDDPGLDPGQLGRPFDVVDRSEAAPADDRLVVPGDPVQVERVEVPQTDVHEPCPDVGGDQARVPHLGQGRDAHPALPGVGGHRFEGGLVNCQIDHLQASFDPSRVRSNLPAARRSM